jgi:predicted nucleotidyltransferase
MDKREVVEKVKRYANLIRNYFPVEMVILFGSYSRGNAREYSDIDVAVVVDRSEHECLESEVQLYKLRRQIDVRIEPVLIDRSGKDPAGFFSEILNSGEIIYQN